MGRLITICDKYPNGCAPREVVDWDEVVKFELIGKNQLKIFTMQVTHPAYPDHKEIVAHQLIDLEPCNTHIRAFITE